MISRKYDAVVVGAGNGGLTAAAVMATKGMKVLLLEQHNLPGGFATSFVRGRFEFEPSLHEISDFGPPENKGNVRRLLEDVIKLDVEWVRVPEAYRLIIPEEKGNPLDVTMPFGVKEYLAKIEEYVPGSKKAVERFIMLCAEVVEAFNYLAASKGKADKDVLLQKYPNFLKTAAYSLEQVIKALNIPYRAAKIITAYWCYLGLGVNRLNFTTYAAMFYKYLTYGAFIPRYRSNGFSSALEKRIRELEGTVEYNTKVEKILVEKGKVRGVETSWGERIMTSHVVSNASSHLSYNQLVFPKKEVPSISYRSCNARKVGPSAFVVYLGLDKSPLQLGIKEYSYFIYSTPTTEDIYKSFNRLETPLGQATVCLNNAIPDCSPQGTTILYLTTLFHGDVWKDVKPQNYVKTKNNIANGLVREFERCTGTSLFPHIEEMEVATPMTFARYTGAFNGSIYGYEPESWDAVLPRMMMLNEDKYIDGLHHSGGFAFRCHGYASSLLSGETAALLTYQDFIQSNE